MGLGSTAKKIQKVGDLAEKLYAQVRELRERVAEMKESLDRADQRMADIEERMDRQDALIEALAEREGVDVEATLAEAGFGPETESEATTVGTDGADASEAPTDEADPIADETATDGGDAA
jgi:DNA anti-recombination protein RmuC